MAKKFKVGDKVRILDVSNISFGRKYYYDGMETDVIRIDSDGDVYLRAKDGSVGIFIVASELHAIELVEEDANMQKYKTEKRHAKVGERILITYAEPINGQDYAKGDVFTVTEADVICRGDVYVKGQSDFVDRKEYEVIVGENVTLESRVSELEAEVSALKAQLAAGEAKPKQTTVERLRTHLDAKASDYYRKTRFPTPNSRRADVIKRARAFVADLEGRAIGAVSNGDGNYLFNQRVTELTFHVNADKGVVTALAHGRNDGKLLAKAFARCAPGDEFNADIGKAIAAGRLYGVKVPADFLDAPKPTEVEDGQIVTFPKLDEWHRKVNYRVDGFGERSDDLEVVRDEFDGDIGMRAHTDGSLGRLVIIDDTEAQY